MQQCDSAPTRRTVDTRSDRTEARSMRRARHGCAHTARVRVTRASRRRRPEARPGARAPTAPPRALARRASRRRGTCNPTATGRRRSPTTVPASRVGGGRGTDAFTQTWRGAGGEGSACRWHVVPRGASFQGSPPCSPATLPLWSCYPWRTSSQGRPSPPAPAGAARPRGRAGWRQSAGGRRARRWAAVRRRRRRGSPVTTWRLHGGYKKATRRLHHVAATRRLHGGYKKTTRHSHGSHTAFTCP